MRRILIIVGVVVVLAAGAYVIVNNRSAGSGAATTGSGGGSGGRAAQAPVRTIIVDQGPVDLNVSATGNIVARQTASLAFDNPGLVLEVPVTEDQQVQAGQLLARQDDSTQQANLTQARFNVQAAQAVLKKLTDPVDPGAIAKADANVKSAEGAYSSQAT